MRKSKMEVNMNVAEAVAQRSHDAETQVGAVLVKNDSGAIIATGFNGFVRGAPDDKLPSTRPEKYPYMRHAEENIISNCARHGISTNNCTLFCTLTPCCSCMRLLWQCGITIVIAKEKYRDWEKLIEMQDLAVDMSMTPEGYWRLTYKEKS